MNTTMQNTLSNAQHALRTAQDGVRAVSDLVAAIRAFRMDDGLGWFGLERQRGPLPTFGAFSVGFAAGAGVALLLAPRSGAATRRAIVQRFIGDREPTAVISDAAGRVKTAVVDTATKVEQSVASVAQKVRHAGADAAHASNHSAPTNVEPPPAQEKPRNGTGRNAAH